MNTFVIKHAGVITYRLPFLDALTELESFKSTAMAQQQIDADTLTVSMGVNGSAEISLPSVNAEPDSKDWEDQWTNWENAFDQAILFVVSQR